MAKELHIPLAEAIRALRAEIVEAQELAQGETVRFGLGNVELEFQLVVSRDGGASGGLNFGVVSFGASGTVASSDRHTLKLTLTPVNASGNTTLYVGDRIAERPR